MKKTTTLILVILLFLLIVFFIDRSPDPEPKPEIISITGNLIINNPGLEENAWYLSYEKEGSPGLLKKLTIKEDVVCSGPEDNCSDLLNLKEGLAGKRVEVKGESDNADFYVLEIDFLEVSVSSCDFKFSDFKTEAVLEKEPTVDFETNPEAKNFQTAIKNAVKNGPNFAGNHVLVSIGCGTSCSHATIVNLENGKIVVHGLLSSHGFAFEKDSNLLVVNPKEALEYIEEGSLFAEVKSEYYVLEEDDLKLLCEE